MNETSMLTAVSQWADRTARPDATPLDPAAVAALVGKEVVVDVCRVDDSGNVLEIGPMRAVFAGALLDEDAA